MSPERVVAEEHFTLRPWGLGLGLVKEAGLGQDAGASRGLADGGQGDPMLREVRDDR